MDLDECIHGLGPIQACTICNGRDERERQTAAEAVRTFPARYEGQCATCDLPIRVGDMIAWAEGAPVIHEHCTS